MQYNGIYAVMAQPPMTDKEPLRREISQQVDEFLRAGGAIDVLPGVDENPRKSIDIEASRGLGYSVVKR